jgi:hypothetical protein
VDRLLQHTDDPRGVVAELARVVRAGGRVVLVDTDWTTLTISCGVPELEREVVSAVVRRVARHPTAGAELAGWVLGSPLTVLSFDRHRLASTSLPLIRQIAHLDDAERVAVHGGRLRPEDVDEWRAALRHAEERGTLRGELELGILVAQR